ncbi:MAG: MBL fold metallo-hydrolase, partial [bacterium]|nr:MBL fold metallo-hydrolase [bacterium]
MTLTFYGGTGEVTGANYLLEVNGTKILVDCGMVQGCHYCEKRNYEPFGYQPASIDYLFVTHAHIDHIGRIPRLYADGFRGKIFATEPTRELTRLSLVDSERLLSEEARRRNLKPLYTAEDVDGTMELFKKVSYGETMDLGGGVTVLPHNAGHILGSTFYEFRITEQGKEKVIVFSGDLGNPPTPLLPDTEPLPAKVDVLLVESTYGGRIHESREERQTAIERAIEETVQNKGTMIIPAFALERTQELLTEIEELVEEGRIPHVPIFLDSPMAIRATKIYQQFESYYNTASQEEIKHGQKFFDFPGLHMTLTKEESKKINEVPSPKIVIAGSGMSTGGRVIHHEKRYVSDPDNMVLIVGYQAQGTMGRQILDGAKEI